MGQDQPRFKKEIRLFDAVMLVAGTMIGSGIFIVSADIAQKVGSSGWLLVVWGIAGIITLSGALSYGELTSMMPGAGGQYVFLREAYNSLIAFLYGWTLFLVIQTGTIAAVSVAFAKFTDAVFPSLHLGQSLFHIGSFEIKAQQLVAIGVIALLTFFNLRGVKNGKLIQNIFGSTKIIALVILIAAGLFIGLQSNILSINFSNTWKAVPLPSQGSSIFSSYAFLAAVVSAMVGALFSSDAWNNVSFAGDEIVNPKRTIALSLAIGTCTVTAIYLLTNFAYLSVLPLEGAKTGTNVFERGIAFATDDRVAAAAAEAVGGTSAVLIIGILIMISTFSCLNGCILSGARVYYKMAVDRLFFSSMGRLNTKSVPAAALILQGAWASVLCLSGTYNNLLDYVIFAVLLFYILTISGIFILRKKRPEAPRPYKAFGYPMVPALYVAAAAIICLILLIEKPAYTWPGVGIVLFGIPVYFYFRTKSKSVSAEPKSNP